MKKTTVLKLLAVLLLSVCFVLTAVACGETSPYRVVKEITVFSAPTEPYVVGDTEIDLSQVVLLVTYTNKTSEKIRLDDTMIDGAEKSKFSVVGTHTVIVSYGGKEGYYQFEVVAAEETPDYLATFYSTGGTVVDSYYTSEIKAFSSPEREGYAFDGWYLDMQYTGSRIREPYALTKDTVFYAKWIDNRVCTVTFCEEVGHNREVIYQEKIHYGEKIDVNSFEYPAERVQNGKTFSYWDVTNGNANNVTVDLVVMARFIVDKCTIEVHYANTDGQTIQMRRDFEYQTEFSVGEGTMYVKPEKEGYTSRFVVYYNHAEDRDGAYEELPENNTIVLTEPYTTVKAVFTVLTYDVLIFNGKATQTEAGLKSGEIELERTYENASALRNFSVDWNTSFDFEEYTQEPNIAKPTTIVGYDALWCFVSSDKEGNEILYNGSGEIWNAEKQIFESPEERPEGETDSYWKLYDGNDNYIATIVGGKLTAIQNAVTVKALYRKRTYSVRLIRLNADGSSEPLVTFSVKYLTDFNIYDYRSYPYEEGVQVFPARDVTSFTYNSETFAQKATDYNPSLEETDIEKLFLKENTDFAVKKMAQDGGYYLTNQVQAENEAEEDWLVTWYNSSTSQESEAVVDFKNGANEKSVITSSVTFYCRDTDNRKYELLFYHRYNFETDWYDAAENPVSGKFYYGEKEIVSPPITTENIGCTVNGVALSYVFIGWYDIPYSVYLKTGTRGNRLTDFSKRNSSVRYYAHYECNLTGTISIYDKTQSIAYIGKTETDPINGYTYDRCAVEDKTIVYNLPAGSYFDLGIVYKGMTQSDASGNVTILNGQTFYDNYKTNVFYKTYYTDGGLRTYLVNRFGVDAATTMRAICNVLQAFENDFKKCISDVYSHKYYLYNRDETGEFAYYLLEFDNVDPDVHKITTLYDEFEYLLPKGGNICRALTDGGYTYSLMQKLGNLYDLIEYYATLLKTLHEEGYETKHTGLSALSAQNSDLELERTFSTYRMITAVRHILEEYAEFLDEGETFSVKEVSPKYENSDADLNHAYGFTGVGEDIKYSFSGWYTNAGYTRLYQQEFKPLSFVVAANDNVSLYAKWTDITRGTEGLVYEEVSTTDGELPIAYVLVDFVNKKEYTSNTAYASANYSVTTNDVGDVPESVTANGSIDLQIPSKIDKYVDVTDQAAMYENAWIDHYRNYYMLQNGAYVQASPVYSSQTKYYELRQYDVIGIAENALTRYAEYISTVTIPLSLRFVEEGAFKNCNVNSFSTMGNDVSLGYVTVPDTEDALYQKNRFDAGVWGNESGKVFKCSENTILAYRIAFVEGPESTYSVEYTLQEGTEYIGKNAFRYAKYLVALKGMENVKEIHDQAFYGATGLTTLGDTENVITLSDKIRYIGDSAFENCAKITVISIGDRSNLAFVGKRAFAGTNWYETQYGIAMLRFTDSAGNDVAIALGHSHVSKSWAIKDKMFNELGEEDPYGGYYGMVTDGAILLLSEAGSIEYVYITVDLVSVSESTFDGLNCHRFILKSVGTVHDRAFAQNAQMTLLEIKNAFRNAPTILGESVFYGKGERTVELVFGSDAIKDIVTNDASWTRYASIFTE